MLHALRWFVIIVTGLLSAVMVKIDRIVLGVLGSFVFGFLLGLALFWFSVPRDWDNIIKMSIGIALCAITYGIYLGIIFLLSLVNTVLKAGRDREKSEKAEQ